MSKDLSTYVLHCCDCFVSRFAEILRTIALGFYEFPSAAMSTGTAGMALLAKLGGNTCGQRRTREDNDSPPHQRFRATEGGSISIAIITEQLKAEWEKMEARIKKLEGDAVTVEVKLGEMDTNLKDTKQRVSNFADDHDDVKQNVEKLNTALHNAEAQIKVAGLEVRLFEMDEAVTKLVKRMDEWSVEGGSFLENICKFRADFEAFKANAELTRNTMEDVTAPVISS